MQFSTSFCRLMANRLLFSFTRINYLTGGLASFSRINETAVNKTNRNVGTTFFKAVVMN